MRLNVSHTHPDIVVREVIDKLDRESLVTGGLGDDGVEGVINATFRQNAPDALSLDLIAHSRGGLLHLGDWDVNADDIARKIRVNCADTLAAMPLREIRLLGCNTAVRPAGRQAMRGLAEIFGARVLGTTAPISANDFDQNEFRACALLVDHEAIRRMPGPVAQATARWFEHLPHRSQLRLRDLKAKLRPESEAEALHSWDRAHPSWHWEIREYAQHDFEALFEHAEIGAAQVPGMLALPDLEIVVRILGEPGAQRFHRLTVLLDHELVRVYPRGVREGSVFRVRQTRAWQAALTLGQVIRRARR